MKALTICQPYAHLIAVKKKLVENRNWSTLFRGPLAIHAGMSGQWLRGFNFQEHGIVEADMDFGCIVAYATLVDCMTASEVLIRHRGPEYRDYAEGPYCFILQNVQRLANPVRCKGALGFWNVPDEIENLVLKNMPSPLN